MQKLLRAYGGVCRDFWGGYEEGMPELLGALGGVCRNCSGLRGGYAGAVVRSEGVCRNFWWLWGGYAGTLMGSQGGMPELSDAQGG